MIMAVQQDGPRPKKLQIDRSRMNKALGLRLFRLLKRVALLNKSENF